MAVSNPIPEDSLSLKMTNVKNRIYWYENHPRSPSSPLRCPPSWSPPFPERAVVRPGPDDEDVGDGRVGDPVLAARQRVRLGGGVVLGLRLHAGGVWNKEGEIDQF